MKYLSIILFFCVFSSCSQSKKNVITKNQNLKCVVRDFKDFDKNSHFDIDLSDFKLFFLDVKSIDLPKDDFKISSKNDTIFITKLFLESDDLFDKKIVFSSKDIDSVSISATYKNDLVFYGSEKNKIVLDETENKTKNLACENGVYLPYEQSKITTFNNKTLNKAKTINEQHFKNVIKSSSYGESDKKDAFIKLKDIEENDDLNFDDLFIEYSTLEVIYDFKYFIKSKVYIKTVVIN